MNIGVPKETFPNEQRVALIPPLIPKLTAAGFNVMIQEGAGRLAGFTDEEFQAKGAVTVTDRRSLFSQSDYIFLVHALNSEGKMNREDLDMMHQGQILISLLNPLAARTWSKHWLIVAWTLLLWNSSPGSRGHRAWTYCRPWRPLPVIKP